MKLKGSYTERIAKSLDNYRIQNKWTYKRVAQKSGASESTVRRFLRDLEATSTNNFFRICKGLGLEVQVIKRKKERK